MYPHPRHSDPGNEINPDRWNLLKNARKMADVDGLNNLQWENIFLR